MQVDPPNAASSQDDISTGAAGLAGHHTNLERTHDMQARIKNPALSVPGALEALQQLGTSASTAEIPETTLYIVNLRASQINGCSICVDIHSRELEHAGESSERIHTVAAWRETP
jgi:AhpD family alkylhydroperoxidase